MEAKKLHQDGWLIRLKKGEEILKTLVGFCQKKRISGGFFWGIGAVSRVELAHYDVAKKKYRSLTFNQPLEMVSLTGTLGKEKDLILHAHALFTDAKMKTLGGHLVEATISGTAEIYFLEGPPLVKKYDPETGLKLFNLKR